MPGGVKAAALYTNSGIRKGVVKELYELGKFSINAGVLEKNYTTLCAGYEILNKNGLSIDILAGAGTPDFKQIELNAGAAISFKL